MHQLVQVNALTQLNDIQMLVKLELRVYFDVSLHKKLDFAFSQALFDYQKWLHKNSYQYLTPSWVLSCTFSQDWSGAWWHLHQHKSGYISHHLLSWKFPRQFYSSSSFMKLVILPQNFLQEISLCHLILSSESFSSLYLTSITFPSFMSHPQTFFQRFSSHHVTSPEFSFQTFLLIWPQSYFQCSCLNLISPHLKPHKVKVRRSYTPICPSEDAHPFLIGKVVTGKLVVTANVTSAHASKFMMHMCSTQHLFRQKAAIYVRL